LQFVIGTGELLLFTLLLFVSVDNRRFGVWLYLSLLSWNFSLFASLFHSCT